MNAISTALRRFASAPKPKPVPEPSPIEYAAIAPAAEWRRVVIEQQAVPAHQAGDITSALGQWPMRTLPPRIVEGGLISLPPNVGYLVRQLPTLAGTGVYRFGQWGTEPTGSRELPPRQVYANQQHEPTPLGEPIACASCGAIAEWLCGQPSVCISCALAAATPAVIGEPLGTYTDLSDVANALASGRLRADNGGQLVLIAPAVRWGRGSSDTHEAMQLAARRLARLAAPVCACRNLDESDSDFVAYAAEAEPTEWRTWWGA